MNKDNDKFLVMTDAVCRRDSLLGHLVLHAVGNMDLETQKKLLAPAKERGGKIDIRIVIEGESFPFTYVDRLLWEDFERAKNQALQDYLEEKIDEMKEKVRESLTPFIEDFGLLPQDLED